MVSDYRAMHHLRKGGLNKAMGVPGGYGDLSSEHIEKAMGSKNSHVKAMAELARLQRDAEKQEHHVKSDSGQVNK